MTFPHVKTVLRPQDVDSSSGTNVIPMQNRALLSSVEMNSMDRFDGDLFAVFSFEGAPDQILYSKYSDFRYAVDCHIELFKIINVDEFTRLFMTGSLMLSRLHELDILAFDKLVDHNLEEIFDRKDFISWFAINPEFFSLPGVDSLDDRISDSLAAF